MRPPACPATFQELANRDAGAVDCRCGLVDTTRPVWGTGVYTEDSALCTAALHAGAIGDQGGTVTVRAAAGCQRYPGGQAHGVTSGEWGAFGASFFFVGYGDGACAAYVPTEACPSSFQAAGTGKTGDVSCTCGVEQLTGAVWGSDAYTQDSSLCAAALHAGVIDAKGGAIKASGAAGCQAYTASSRNGVKSGAWGAYDASFYFPAKGRFSCVQAEANPDDACPSSFAERAGGTDVACVCPADASGSVWGTETYTQDSSVCGAARHVGAISAKGGAVTARATGGCKGYLGTERNGIASSSWGAYEASFYFPGSSDGRCVEQWSVGMPCPQTFAGLPPDTDRVSCSCGSTGSGSVWGTGVYTADSSICQAARHAGILSGQGGTVEVQAAPGCGGYQGSSAHGVDSGNWGAYHASFFFPASGTVKCTR